jgi:hypothetical protein
MEKRAMDKDIKECGPEITPELRLKYPSYVNGIEIMNRVKNDTTAGLEVCFKPDSFGPQMIINCLNGLFKQLRKAEGEKEELKEIIKTGASSSLNELLFKKLETEKQILIEALEKIASNKLLHDTCTGSCELKHLDTSLNCYACIAQQAIKEVGDETCE